MSKYIEDWADEGICRQVDPDLWFAEVGDSGSVKKAKAVCGGCPVQAPCLEYALTNKERFGVFGGKSERERRKILDAMASENHGVAA